MQKLGSLASGPHASVQETRRPGAEGAAWGSLLKRWGRAGGGRSPRRKGRRWHFNGRREEGQPLRSVHASQEPPVDQGPQDPPVSESRGCPHTLPEEVHGPEYTTGEVCRSSTWMWP